MISMLKVLEYADRLRSISVDSGVEWEGIYCDNFFLCKHYVKYSHIMLKHGPKPFDSKLSGCFKIAPVMAAIPFP